MRETITQQRLRELVSYDADTGIFTWVAKWRGILTGHEAGSVDPNGYRVIRLDKTDYLAQRLAWFWVRGSWPRLIRFQNGERADCRIENLCEGFYLTTKHDSRTKEGRASYQLEYRAARREVFSAKQRERKYGITLAEYSEKVAAQGNLCAICGKPETECRGGKLKALGVDHNHETNEIRDLLCTACNKLIGLANEDRDVLLSAIKYLDRHSGEAVVSPLYRVTPGVARGETGKV